MNNAGYSFISKSLYEYEFYTAYGAGYSVLFDSASSYFPANNKVTDLIFSIDIQLIYPGAYNHYDLVIGITIAEIILIFFNADNRHIIFYICDPVDGKMAARSRKFNYWFNTFGSKEFKKIVAVLKGESIIVEANFIFKKDNVFAYDLPIIIDEAKDNLSK